MHVSVCVYVCHPRTRGNGLNEALAVPHLNNEQMILDEVRMECERVYGYLYDLITIHNPKCSR